MRAGRRFAAFQPMIFRVAVLSLLGSSFLTLMALGNQHRRCEHVHRIAAALPVNAQRLTVDTVLVDVRRDELERLTPAALRDIRAVPHLHRGKVDGLRLYGIHRASLWRTLGLQNGDVVYEVNGAIPTAPSDLAPIDRCQQPHFLDMTIRRRSRTLRIVVMIHAT